MYWKRSLYYFSLSLSLLFLSIFIDCSVLAVFSFFSYLVVCAVCVLCICLYCLLVSSCNRAHAPIKYTRSLVKVCAHTLTELANFSSDRSEHEKEPGSQAKMISKLKVALRECALVVVLCIGEHLAHDNHRLYRLRLLLGFYNL